MLFLTKTTKKDIFVKKKITFNYYKISSSGFRIGMSKLILNSKNLFRIPYLVC